MTPDILQTQDVCIYANNGGGDYQVRTTSANALGPQWRIHDGIGNYVDYDVAWVDSAGGTFAGNTAGATWGSGDTSVNQDNGDFLDPACGAGDTATLAIQILATDLTAAPDGSYEDTLTILITPN